MKVYKRISFYDDIFSERFIKVIVMVVPEIITKQAEKISLACPWLKRVGFWGFMFFFIKGLAWLIVPAVLVYLGQGGG